MPSKTHGRSTSPEYNNWCNMRQRCNNPNHPNYKHYGGRGIAVCRRWSTFENFLADMGNRPFPKATVERKDNSKGYEPDNCVWAARKTQCRNKRSNHLLTIDGVSKPISEWAEHFKISDRKVWKRISLGWPPLEALTAPNLTKWSRRRKCNYAT